MKAVLGFISLPLALLLLPGCHRQEGKDVVTAAPTAAAANLHPGMGASRQEAAVQVPAAVKAKWKAMKIGLLDLATKQETPYVVKADSELAIPGTGLTLRALALVPDFTMDNGVITSRGEAANNPAAQIQVTEGGKTIFRGWLFVRFPEAHPFEHPKYALRLLELVPA